MRRTTALVLVGALVASLLGLVATAGPAAAYPYNDTIPASGSGSPGDHGWFEAGKQWVGDFGDPTVVKVGSTYYAYSSPTGGRYLPVLTSTDLRTWKIHPNWSTAGPPGAPGYDPHTDPAIPSEIRGGGFSDWDTYLLNDGLVAPPSWGLTDVQGPWIKKDYWAPGVIQMGSTWYAYGAMRTSWTSDDPHGYGRFCLTVATASSPFGPFRDASGPGPIQCQSPTTDPAGSIDPFPWQDPSSGKYFLLWKAAGKVGGAESSLHAIELDPATGRLKAGAPDVKLLETNRGDPWEGGTIENPGMVSFGGTTYLFYSANDSASDANGVSAYATGYAVCPSGPLAACTRVVHSPLLASNAFKQGPGGSSPFVGTDGRLRVAYATYEWLEPARSNGLHPRRLNIGVLSRNADGTLRYLGDEADAPPPTAPVAPPAPVAAAGDGWATVSWSPPSSDGGDAITGYTVTSSPGAKTCSWTSGPRWCTVSGLADGTGYTFTVKAQNGLGTSPASPASNVVTPAVPVADLFHPVDPTRIVDTRPSTQVGPFSTPFTAGATRNIQMAVIGPVPAGADAVALNVTVTDTTSASFMTLWPKGQARPSASNLNWNTGATIPNAVTVKLGADDSVSVYSAVGTTNVIVDVVGYYEDGAVLGGGAGFTPLTPTRLLDTRPSTQVGPFSTPWSPETTRPVTVAGGAVPSGADAVVLNATVTDTTAGSFLTAWPHGTTRPQASNLNWSPGQTIANAVTVKVGDGGRIDVYSTKGTVNVVLDVVGYFDAGSGAAFHPLTPARVQDSRPPTPVGAFTTPWGPGTTRSIPVGGAGGVPPDAQAVLANATVTDTTSGSFLTVWPTGQSMPTASTLNWSAGLTIPNALTARLGTAGQVSAYSPLGSVQVILDVSGWYG
ncbi:MAG: family 43 glycosylhydrolase [Acidimicrobiales bacterium]